MKLPAEFGPMEKLSSFVVVLGLNTWVLQWFLGSPYGRHSRATFGPTLPGRLAWFVQELPSLLVPLYVTTCSPAPRLRHWPNRILLAIFITHYLQRSLIFPFLIRGGKPVPVLIFTSAFMFCSLNGYLQSQYLSNYAVYPDNWVKDLRFITGCAMWLIGMLINIHSDNILRNLRKPGETGYKIPRGGLFEYVTAANFSGEIMEWYGYALASWSFAGVAFALFTTTNLSIRAKEHHRILFEIFHGLRPVHIFFRGFGCRSFGFIVFFITNDVRKYLFAEKIRIYSQFFPPLAATPPAVAHFPSQLFDF